MQKHCNYFKPLSSTINRISQHTPAPADSLKPKVAVIIGYYNGNTYLAEQVRSILAQTYSNIQIFITDDCSSDAVDISKLNLSKDESEQIYLGVQERNLGFVQNFLTSLSHIPKTFEYIAFADQDDIWYPNKIETAVAKLCEMKKAGMYCSRTAAFNTNCEVFLGLSPLFSRPPSFENALVQSIAGGNTMVLNRKAVEFIIEASKNVTVVTHDWWCYQVVTACGGTVFYDRKPTLKYRQHPDNIVGSSLSWTSKIRRTARTFRGNYASWNDINIAALENSNELITPKNRECLANFKASRQASIFQRYTLFKRSNVYRHGTLSNALLLCALLLKKI